MSGSANMQLNGYCCCVQSCTSLFNVAVSNSDAEPGFVCRHTVSSQMSDIRGRKPMFDWTKSFCDLAFDDFVIREVDLVPTEDFISFSDDRVD
jgi:hypothetical protein